MLINTIKKNHFFQSMICMIYIKEKFPL